MAGTDNKDQQRAGEGDEPCCRAEAMAEGDAAPAADDGDGHSLLRMRRLLHELQGHQIELERQNDELRRARMERDDARAFHFDFYNLAPVGYCTVNQQGEILRANLTLAGLLGVGREALLKQPLSHFVLPADLELYDRYCKQFQATRAIQAWDLRLRRADGDFLWAQLQASVAADADGAPVCHLVISDITPRKQAEEGQRLDKARYLSIIEDQTELICRYTPEGKLSFVNGAYARYYGKRPDELININFIPHIPEAEMAMIDGLIAAITPENPLTKYEHRVITATGEVRWQRWTHRCIYGAEGELVEHQAVGHDITDRKHVEELVVRSLQEKEVMLKEIHHRVKNNLQVVCSLLNLQAKRIADPQTRIMFEESRDRVMSMALVHEKLYQAKDLAHIDFKEYLQRVATGLAATYNQPNVAICVGMDNVSLNVNVGIPCGLIVNELLSNALKYAFADGRKGTITLGIALNDQGHKRLIVEDDGIGFPAEVDFRNTSSLGLQIVMGLIGQIHGVIELSRAAGSRFAITFP